VYINIIKTGPVKIRIRVYNNKGDKRIY